MTTISVRADPPSITRAAVSAVAVMAVFIAHHLYGAAIYTAAFRKHAALVGAPVTLAIALSAYLAIKLGSKAGRALARRVAYALILVFPVLLVGVFEGLYNHVLKNVIFFTGLYAELSPMLYPGGAYERPGDWLFEVSGVLQFVLAVIAARELWRAHALEPRKVRRP